MKVETAVGSVLSGALVAVVLTSGLLAPRGVAPARDDGPPSFAPRAAEAAGDAMVLQDAWPGATFDSPICVAFPADDSDRLFVAQRTGKILSIKKWRGSGPAAAPKTLLDLSSLQSEEAINNGQGGLLSVAVHPKFKTDGRLFVFYGTSKPQAVVAAYRVSKGDPDRCDPASGQILLTVDKPHMAHYGGGLAFGPDGKLYVGLGDSGTKVDPKAPQDSDSISQDVHRLDGKILRIDVDARQPYGVPADNPWATAGGGVRGEIWAYGVRNPWRFSFDREGGAMWMGDPGQQRREEVNVVPRAGNLGWALREGTMPLQQGAPPAELVPPVFDYGREMGKCVIGGCVYRGQRCSPLKGQYVFADFSASKLFAMPISGSRSTGAPRAIGDIESCASINEDAEGELYLCALESGKILTLAPAP